MSPGGQFLMSLDTCSPASRAHKEFLQKALLAAMRVWLHQGIHEQQCCEAQYLMLLVYSHEQTETRLLKQVRACLNFCV